jgi:hypothetical protein
MQYAADASAAIFGASSDRHGGGIYDRRTGLPGVVVPGRVPGTAAGTRNGVSTTRGDLRRRSPASRESRGLDAPTRHTETRRRMGAEWSLRFAWDAAGQNGRMHPRAEPARRARRQAVSAGAPSRTCRFVLSCRQADTR